MLAVNGAERSDGPEPRRLDARAHCAGAEAVACLWSAHGTPRWNFVSASRPLRMAIACAALLLPSCAIPPDDVHLAPLYSHHRLAAGGSSHEALGGIFEWRREDRARVPLGSTGGYGDLDADISRPPVVEWAVRPLVRRRSQGGASELDVLWPFGHFLDDSEESFHRFFPFWWWKRHLNEAGESEVDWSLFPPFIFGGHGTPENTYFAFFPFFGTLHDFFTYDRLTFVMFPIFGSSQKSPNDRKAYGILIPFTGWGSGDDGSSWWRLWPFYGRSEWPQHYDRAFAMWPFWHSEANYLDTSDPSREWLAWPFYGEVDRGAFHARSILWPFFGWEWNSETGYSAWDGPWPAVKVIRGGAGHPYSETRVLPFFAFYRSVEIDSTTILWPILWFREERTTDADKSSVYVLPFFVGSSGVKHRTDPKSGEAVDHPASTTMVWPLYRGDRNPDWGRRDELLWPLPLPRLAGFRENWFPFFSLYSRDESPEGAVSQRVILDLFRREANDREERWSVPVLGGRRATSEGATEWSLLLGLLRWRSDANGTRWLAPAIPGPGFSPLEAPPAVAPAEEVR